MLSVLKLECQRMSGPQKRTKSEFIYCPQGYRPRSRKLDMPLSAPEVLEDGADIRLERCADQESESDEAVRNTISSGLGAEDSELYMDSKQ